VDSSGHALWTIVSQSRQGRSHEHHGLPNQDAYLTKVIEGGRVALAAVADGHGNPKHFRSDVGSRLAVESTVDVLEDFVRDLGASPPSIVKDAAERFLFDRILQEWRKRVLAHWESHPVLDSEAARVVAEKGDDAKVLLTPVSPLVVYGATLLATLHTDRFIIAVQHGDGFIAISDGDGESMKYVRPPDEEDLFRSDSLCQPDSIARANAKVHFQSCTHERPALTLLTTDGFFNAYVNPSVFPTVVLRFAAERKNSDWPECAETSLAAKLDQAFREGMGDDTTVALVYRNPSESPDHFADADSRGQSQLDAAATHLPPSPGPGLAATTAAACSEQGLDTAMEATPESRSTSGYIAATTDAPTICSIEIPDQSPAPCTSADRRAGVNALAYGTALMSAIGISFLLGSDHPFAWRIVEETSRVLARAGVDASPRAIGFACAAFIPVAAYLAMTVLAAVTKRRSQSRLSAALTRPHN